MAQLETDSALKAITGRQFYGFIFSSESRQSRAQWLSFSDGSKNRVHLVLYMKETHSQL
jgi:hypothetical protein